MFDHHSFKSVSASVVEPFYSNDLTLIFRRWKHFIVLPKKFDVPATNLLAWHFEWANFAHVSRSSECEQHLTV